MDTGGLSKQRLGRMYGVLAGHVERGELPGLVALVARRDEVHVEVIGTKAVGAADPMRRDTIFRIASMTKPIIAAAAMLLVEECVLRLDDPVDGLLPELADRRVLKRLDGPVDDTVPAHRPITLRDLLTFRMGLGAVMAAPGQYPIQRAMADAGLAPGPNPPSVPQDEWMRRIGELPLAHQPGEGWMYHTGADVLGVLISRASGQPLADFLRHRLFEPLGMADTGFHVPREKLGRLATSYRREPATGRLKVHDDPETTRWARPAFASGGGGLVSTADDYLAFCQLLLNKGRSGGERILSRPAVELMMTDHLTSEQKAANRIFFGDGAGWGFGGAVITRRTDFASVGRYGWDGGIGTTAHTDPAEDLIGILLTQRMMDSPQPPSIFRDFWTLAYQAIDD